MQVNDRLTLGLSDNGHWTASGRSSVTELRSGVHPLHLFPLLEREPISVLTAVKAWVGSNQGDRTIDSFPVGNLIAAALRSGSDGWERHALRWAEAIDRHDEIDAGLHWAAEHAVTQASRHKAKRLAA